VAVTLREVAERAGVSTRTVSNVVNDYEHVSGAMRAKVQQAIDELGYRPNMLARGLRQGRTGIITLLVPQITVPYFGELAHEIVVQATALGFTVMIDETEGDPERELALLKVASGSSWVDGVLLSSLGLEERVLTALTPAVPVVLLGERTADGVLDHVGIDNVRAATDAVQFLLNSGRRRIAAIGGDGAGSDHTSRPRLAGYQAALRAAGLPVDPQLYAPTPDYSRTSGMDAVTRLFSQAERPDALFCFSDDLATGSLRQLHNEGLRVPVDVSVVGFDDVEGSRFTIPSLTSVSPDKVDLARSALAMLIDRIGGSTIPARDVRVGHGLAMRESAVATAAPADAHADSTTSSVNG
jgi:LacI family repressor for deo operon, udp, cdd, tsx, nupC, and nupG